MSGWVAGNQTPHAAKSRVGSDPTGVIDGGPPWAGGGDGVGAMNVEPVIAAVCPENPLRPFVADG